MIPAPVMDDRPAAAGSVETAVIGAGCFWCSAAVYDALPGVLRVMPGYSGGAAETARYRLVCSGDTGHAEALRIEYDASQLTYGQLLQVFFGVAHDPTQLNRQGADIGTQYRSVIFTLTERQHEIAVAYIEQLNRENIFGRPVVTVVTPLTAFYEAEPEHHQYAARFPQQPYIAAVAAPKVSKLQQWLATASFPHKK